MKQTTAVLGAIALVVLVAGAATGATSARVGTATSTGTRIPIDRIPN